MFLFSNNINIQLERGLYRFVDGFFVLANTKYYDESSRSLTDLAKNNLSECTLKFLHVAVKKEVKSDVLSILYHRIQDYKKIPMYDGTISSLEEQERALENIEADFETQFKRQQSIHQTTNSCFWKYIQDENWDVKEFQDKTLLSSMDYTRVQNPEYKFKIRTYTAMAVGLGMNLSDMNAVLQLSGLGYDTRKREHYAYAYILSVFHGCPIDECNEVLKQLQVPELGTKSRA